MYTTDPVKPLRYRMTDSSSRHHPLAYSIPLYIQIADRLVSQIESGELAPGDRLPSERELSENRAGIAGSSFAQAWHRHLCGRAQD